MAEHTDKQPTDRQPAAGASARSVDPKLLEILVCPVSKQALEYDAERQELVSRAARLAYPVRDGIPIMLAEEARALGDDE
ncbi:MAG TPA: Trm112 family protein [Aestuariivirgaceae bacterium]|nr:Trm112 family protein [Aestuariivirgaceae bacterium]